MRLLQPKADEEHLGLVPTSPFILHLADDGADDLTQLHRRNHSQLPSMPLIALAAGLASPVSVGTRHHRSLGSQ